MNDATETTSSELEARGNGLLLRYPRESDSKALFRLASDPEVTRFLSWGPYQAEREAEEWLATLPERRAQGKALEFAIVKDNELLGITLLSEFSQRDRRCVLGTWLGRAHWGTGVNGASKALIARIAFEALAIERLGTWADLRNERSQRALERLGFQREGVLRSYHRHDDQSRDLVSYSLLRSEWERSALAWADVEIVGAPSSW